MKSLSRLLAMRLSNKRILARFARLGLLASERPAASNAARLPFKWSKAS